MTVVEYMLTTVDNPYDPFTQYEDWSAFDHDKGYNTAEYLGRLTKTSDELSDLDNKIEIDKAINDVIELNLLGIYRKYTKENFETIEKRTLSEGERESLSMLYGGDYKFLEL